MKTVLTSVFLLVALAQTAYAKSVIKETHAGRYTCVCRHAECLALVTVRIDLDRDADLLTVDGYQDVQSGVPALRIDRRTGTQTYYLASGATVSFLKNDTLRMPGGEIWSCTRE